jgi:hypothetical protein
LFKDTDNKAVIRQAWDCPILERWHKQVLRPLSYFGMPGPEIRDLIDWNHLLGQKTAVQIVRKEASRKEEDLESVRKMHANAMRRDLLKFQVLLAAVEDVILYGHDMNNDRPVLIENGAGGEFRFRYDIVNLDFEGGTGYRVPTSRSRSIGSGSGGNRIEAIRRVFDRQKGHDFILFLTVNVRDTLGDEPMTYLQDQAAKYDQSVIRSIVSWTTNLDKGKKHIQLKTWIPIFILDEAEMKGFRCHCYPPVYYEGYKSARMVHFVFELRYDAKRVLRAASNQRVKEVVQLPLLRSANAVIKTAPVEEQYPGFDLNRCHSEFEFLGRRSQSLLGDRGLRSVRQENTSTPRS